MLKVYTLFLFPLFILLIAAFTFTSCSLQGKIIDKQVKARYGETIIPSKKKQQDNLVIKSSVPVSDDIPSVTTHKTSKVLPLILYWQWQYKNTCILNPQIAINAFTNSITKEVNKGLKEKLNGHTIELNLEKIPNTFSLLEKAHLVFLGLYAFNWSKVTMQTESTEMDLIISYKVLNNSSEIKKGTISLKAKDDAQRLGWFKSLKRATQEYLTQYDFEIISLSKQVVEKINAEL
jgi:hypothetical protein